jgi:hypothetical protein
MIAIAKRIIMFLFNFSVLAFTYTSCKQEFLSDVVGMPTTKPTTS